MWCVMCDSVWITLILTDVNIATNPEKINGLFNPQKNDWQQFWYLIKHLRHLFKQKW